MINLPLTWVRDTRSLNTRKFVRSPYPYLIGTVFWFYYSVVVDLTTQIYVDVLLLKRKVGHSYGTHPAR